MKETNSDRLDELIDSALAEYTDAEPLTGLEQRILRRVEAARPRPHSPFYLSPRWIVALASVLILIGVAIRWRPTRAGAPVVEKTQASVPRQPESVAPQQTAKATEPARSPAPSAVNVRPKVSGKSVLPKKDRFPADSPLTREERALLKWSTRAPEQMRQVLASIEEERAGQPVSIEPIRIEPLPSDGNE
ncbi:MAG: hypothetical protein IT168_14430 [Bryobacterales bacterium]|nr:hypothetical protein [Bryobacterales bacterium]